MLKKLRGYLGEFIDYNRERKQVVQAIANEKELLQGRIIRYVHSIEKGLSIEFPRPEFGYEKIQMLYGWTKQYLNLEASDKTCVYMAADALESYCLYHDAIGMTSEKIEEIRSFASELKEIKEKDKADGVFGGVQTIKKEGQTFEQETIEKFFKTRHSIRQFKKEPVSEELIKKAVELAQTAPSACNRQAVRTYVMDAKKFIEVYPANLQGVGGFVESADKVILITGKISAYEENEYKQFVVTAGIFAGYLSLALHGLGLGACVVQRSLRPDRVWKEFCEKSNIPTDEQIICLVVLGHMNDTAIVPVSKRFDTEMILKWL